MAVRLQFGTILRNARANQFELIVGAAPKLFIRSGAMPTSCASSDTGALLCEITLPANYLSPATNGTVTLLGTWAGTGTSAAGAGTTATYFRIKEGTTTHCQGNITEPAGEGALELESAVIAWGQPVTVTAFSLTDGNS